MSVPRLWAGSTVVCLATGRSLTSADVSYVQGKARVIAISDAYQLAPWADVLYACDSKWWHWHKRKGAWEFPGMKFGCMHKNATHAPDHPAGVVVLRSTGRTGLETDPRYVRDGGNSGYQAIHVAVHLGASRIVLLGYDMHGSHFFGSHQDHSRPSFGSCLAAFATLVEPLRAAGVEVVNCTRKTALEAFPRLSLEEALP
jgi:hypothetical protein